MNFISLLLIFLQQFSCYSSEKDYVAIAMTKIIEQHFVKNSIAFDFVFPCDSEAVKSTFMNIVKQNSGKHTYQVI